jgi:hypothetical protein
MRTITLLLTSALLASCLSTSAQRKTSAKQTDEEIILMPHPEYVSELLNEVNLMNTKVERLRIQAGKMQGTDKTVLNDEADALEQHAQKKHIEALELDYSINSRLYQENRQQVNSLLQTGNVRENNSHVQFLLTESTRNKKTATEMREESNSQKDAANKLGSLDNAEEKILLALRQQNEILVLLRKPVNQVANTK